MMLNLPIRKCDACSYCPQAVPMHALGLCHANAGASCGCLLLALDFCHRKVDAAASKVVSCCCAPLKFAHTGVARSKILSISDVQRGPVRDALVRPAVAITLARSTSERDTALTSDRPASRSAGAFPSKPALDRPFPTRTLSAHERSQAPERGIGPTTWNRVTSPRITVLLGSPCRPVIVYQCMTLHSIE